MDELVTVLESILSELQEMNTKLDEIKGDSIIHNSISDICNKLDDIGDKIDNVGDKVDSLETTITLGDNY